jgi:hypothetical protein
MTLTEKHATIVALDAKVKRAQRLASDAAVGESDVPFEVAFAEARHATVELLTALAHMTPDEIRQGPARSILLAHVAVR